jgi:hypothetical protein
MTSDSLVTSADTDSLVTSVTNQGPEATAPVFVSWTEIEDIVSVVSAEYSVPRSYLVKTVDIENYTSPDGVFVDTEGKFIGLGQFNEATWNAVMDDPYGEASNPRKGIEAIAKLYLANKASFEVNFRSAEYTDEIAYLYHNQGAPSAASFLHSGTLKYPDQSRSAGEVFKVARRQYVNNRNQNRDVTSFV